MHGRGCRSFSEGRNVMNKSRTTRLRQALLPVPFGLLFLFSSMMYATPSWAWGDLGHKIICQIAFQELNDRARNEVARLIALDATFVSFTDRKSTRLNSSHLGISYAVFCLKKKKI